MCVKMNSQHKYCFLTKQTTTLEKTLQNKRNANSARRRARRCMRQAQLHCSCLAVVFVSTRTTATTHDGARAQATKNTHATSNELRLHIN
jgi:hypothetical protein